VKAIYARRHALSTAYPFSAHVWGHGNTFAYAQGIICVLDGKDVRISDLRSQSYGIHLDITAIAGPILERSLVSPRDFTVNLLNYADGILAVHITPSFPLLGGFILVLDTALQCPDDRRIIQIVRLASSSKLFVRHTADYLYYGTHTGRGSDGHHKWEIYGICLHDRVKMQAGTKRLLLDNFHGSDIGSTVVFEIHNGYFYAISNQGTFEVEEIDYTSFYHVVRFPLDSPSPGSIERDERLYRRQHKQGPIHDSWTDLSLQLDEHTNETVIVESRREWAEASSRQSRTFYVTKLEFSSEDSTKDSSDEMLLPKDDVYLPVIESSNKPHWKPTPDLFSWSQHAEFSSTDPAPRSFMLARTKFRAYNYPCTTFLDMVEDERCCNDASKPPCLRLRVGSRREIGLGNSLVFNDKGKTAIVHNTKPKFVDSKTRYQHSPIRMWPPQASRCPCSQRLHDILNPALPSSGAWYTRSVTGVLDEQRLVLMIKSGRPYGPSDDKTLGAVVVIDFARPTEDNDSADSASSGSALMTRSDRSQGWKGAARLEGADEGTERGVGLNDCWGSSGTPTGHNTASEGVLLPGEMRCKVCMHMCIHAGVSSCGCRASEATALCFV
jgi:hypothetical protein